MKIQKISLIMGLLLLIILCGSNYASASTTEGSIITNNKNDGYAWSSLIGWLNFNATNGNIKIMDSGITGYVWNANYGWINMAPQGGGVKVSKDGKLSGKAWNGNLGMIDFNGLSIDSDGKIIGQINGEKIGVVNFDCKNCGVYTDYRPSIYRRESYTETENQNQKENGSLSHIFDIRLLVDGTEVGRLKDLSAHVTFESFGSNPTPVKMRFTVIDSNGREVWREENETTVQTEAVFNRNFLSAEDVPDGKYVLHLDTTYNNDIKDAFEMPFSVNVGAVKIPEQRKFYDNTPVFAGGIAFLIIVVAVIVVKKKPRS